MRHTKLSVLVCKQRKYEGVVTLAEWLAVAALQAACTLHSVARNGEFSQLWELLEANWEKILWGIPHIYNGEFYLWLRTVHFTTHSI